MRKKNSLSKGILLGSFWVAKSFLLISLFGSSVFASSSDLSLVEDMQTEKKDISVFVDRLSERLKGVFEEIVALSAGQLMVSSPSSQNVSALIDVQEHLYASEILALADMGVVDASREKFYPDNYLRRYELVIMMVKHQLVEENKQLSPVVFPLHGWFYDVAQNTSYAPYVAYAEEQWLISQMIVEVEGKKFFFPNKFLSREEVCGILNLDSIHTFCTQDTITRWEFAALLFRGFDSSVESSHRQELSLSKEESEGILLKQLKTMFVLAVNK
jgi:hypothetical protein